VLKLPRHGKQRRGMLPASLLRGSIKRRPRWRVAEAAKRSTFLGTPTLRKGNGNDLGVDTAVPMRAFDNNNVRQEQHQSDAIGQQLANLRLEDKADDEVRDFVALHSLSAMHCTIVYLRHSRLHPRRPMQTIRRLAVLSHQVMLRPPPPAMGRPRPHDGCGASHATLLAKHLLLPCWRAYRLGGVPGELHTVHAESISSSDSL